MERGLDLAMALLEAATRVGAEAADVLVASGVSRAVGVAGGVFEEADGSESVDLGLRVLLGRRQACVSSSDTRAAALREMATRAVAIARAVPEDPWCGLAHEGAPAPDATWLDLADSADPPEPGDLEHAALEAEAAAMAVGGITQVEQASASWGFDRITLAATNGFTGSYARSRYSVGLSAIAGTGLGRERDFASEARAHRADMPPLAEIGTRAAERAVARLGPKKPPGGKVPVLYDERVAGSLIGHVLGAINGTAIARGASWLRDRMGERIMPVGFDVIEDPLILRGPASRPFDAEGFAATRKTLVEDGVLKTWVLDLATARQLGMKSTGNARRGIAAPPSPGTTNIRVTEGAAGRDALIAQMGTGLVVTSMIGAAISATTGAYSRGASGFWVEDGRIAYPVNEVTIAGSLPEMVARMTPANDADPHRAVSVPSLLVEGMTVGA